MILYFIKYNLFIFISEQEILEEWGHFYAFISILRQSLINPFNFDSRLLSQQNRRLSLPGPLKPPHHMRLLGPPIMHFNELLSSFEESRVHC